MAESLEQFLEQSGTPESEGSFTVDINQALKKLGRFQLARPGEHLLKVVQAANALKFEELNIKLGIRTVYAKLEIPPEVDLSPETIALGLTERAPWSSRAARHLGVALQAALGSQDCNSACWRLGDGCLSLGGGGQVECRPDTTKARLGVIVFQRSSLLKGVHAKLFGEQHTVVHRRACFSEVPLRLDSREVLHGWSCPNRRDGDWFDYTTVPYFLMLGLVAPRDHLPGFRFRSAGTAGDYGSVAPLRNRAFKMCRNQMWDGYYELRGATNRNRMLYRYYNRGEYPSGDFRLFGAAFILPLKLSGPAEVRFLLDGVTSRPVAAQWGCPGLQVLVSGEGLAVDLTEFQVVENDLFQQRMEAVRIEASNFMAVARKQKHNYTAAIGRGGAVIDPAAFKKGLSARLG